jgi:hypothetical protein
MLVAAGGHRTRKGWCPHVERPLCWLLSQAPEHVEGEEKKRLGTPGFCNPYVGFSQAPEHVDGDGLLCEGGGGSARLIADDCLKYLFI